MRSDAYLDQKEKSQGKHLRINFSNIVYLI